MSLADETSDKPAVEVVDREPKVSRRETAKQQSKDAAGLVVDAGKRVLDSVADTAASAAEAVMSTDPQPLHPSRAARLGRRRAHRVAVGRP